MSTLAEIEVAAASLSAIELERLERRVHELALARRAGAKVFTGHDAARWWRERAHWPAGDAESFAHDVEAARAEMNVPPRTPSWE